MPSAANTLWNTTGVINEIFCAQYCDKVLSFAASEGYSEEQSHTCTYERTFAAGVLVCSSPHLNAQATGCQAFVYHQADGACVLSLVAFALNTSPVATGDPTYEWFDSKS
jgi:hypothetical protein